MRSLLSTLIVFQLFAPKGFVTIDAEIVEITERTGAYSTDELAKEDKCFLQC